MPLTAHRDSDPTSLRVDIHQKEDVLEVSTDHRSPEVNGKGCGTSKIQNSAPKLDFVGTVFRDLRPNQLIYHFEKIFVPSSDLCATGISVSAL